ncbi:uncharacterized protein LOC129760280 [Uranotaenia lowii]|uniref:uncharacterized protein LOC129760280 n=1 Tax=Uranotaenia lowii TaxID=190385 RepID=UPI0024793612|nr:uncharacterized protein LOC129760280 [Uranotaenia lowii]XP_055613876.1 uncharacterized protein LOC129760280 [Uranotaenia lowii]XP_055613877.1 uncharacterized protein LOC129760280 [Uranotaenia lowii]XP_055613878.1 uncharacterized protein LOC129760280 [Uranotaenia lowii]XP_055613879.1 uncharacterized protein LOC129760280 [Uranotaenia lowii]XP_055613880.1 uncharacterized protein LOC129760280 [Uranotaenia lowii]XP_055613881.1 uncharacterized protein LOC129760280 [Uranotaenia lowii]XP_05561388
MDAPSMVQRDGDKLIVRRVVSGDEVFLNQTDSGSSKDQQSSNQSLADSLKLLSGEEDLSKFGLILEQGSAKGGGQSASVESQGGESGEHQLPQCKIKRNYSCSNCTYFTQNPRKYLTHLRDVHGEKIIINECKRCLYASRHYQKLVRHMKMVHGSTDGIKTPFSSRRRGTFRKDFYKKNKFKMNTNQSAGDLYSQSSANYINQLMKSGLGKMLESAGSGPGSESAGEQAIQFFAANFKPGLTLAEQAQQLSQLKSSPNINIFADNGNGGNTSTSTVTAAGGSAGTSSGIVGSGSGDSASQDVLAMLQNNLVDKGQQLTIMPAGEAGSKSNKKKARPIPDLIPLHSIGKLHLSSEAGKTYHLNPEVTIKSRVVTDSDNNNSIDGGPSSNSKLQYGGEIEDDNPINLTADQNGDKSLQHQCIFCQILVPSTDDLTIHLRTFHSEELLALLLQQKPNEVAPEEALQSYTAESLTFDIWKRILEKNRAILEEQEARESESDMQSGQYSNDEDDAETVESVISKNETYCGVETAPGYGEVTKKITIDEGNTQTAIMKKVFKCPHCSFWASTASRFHVHIVGHLNKKPFECSLCSYRSNWRWDITKHIRLKTIRDPSHKTAHVLMNDETGRRNYTKYNRYITLMKVSDSSYKDSGSASKSMMDVSQADYLAMCKGAESPAGINTLAKMYSSEELAQAFNLANMNQLAQFEPEFLQSLMAMPKMIPIDDAKPMSTPKVAYKCKKCNFKHPFRELVLLHIKSTHQTADKQISDGEIDLVPCDDQDTDQIILVESSPPSTSNNSGSHNNNNSNKNNTNSSTLNPLSPLRPSSSSPLQLLSGVSPRNNDGASIGDLTGASTTNISSAAAVTATPSGPPGLAAIGPAGYNSNHYTTNATLIGVGLNFTQAIVANDNRLGTTFAISNTIPSVGVFGGQEVDKTIFSARATTPQTSIGPSLANAISTDTTTPPCSTTNTTCTITTSNITTSTSTTTTTIASGSVSANAVPSGSGMGPGAGAGSKGTTSSSWRPSAPYRCGHCHQVSNWKHVIQRHCRLKHNGNVLIEMVNSNNNNINPSTSSNNPTSTNNNNNSNAAAVTKPQHQQPSAQNVTDTRNLKLVRKPFQSFDSVSQDIPVHPVTLHPIEIIPEVSLVVQDLPIVVPPPPPLASFGSSSNTRSNAHHDMVTLSPAVFSAPPPLVPMTFINLTEDAPSSLELHPQYAPPQPMMIDDCMLPSDTDLSMETEPDEPRPPAPATRTKRYQCEACPYVTDSRTQFAYHKSFHKPRGDPYKCNICSYNVTKKHLLIQHQKTHAEKPTFTSRPLSKSRITECNGEQPPKSSSSGLMPAEILDLTKKMNAEVSITPAVVASSIATSRMHVDPKVVYYCTNCPARYFDESEIVIHQNRHIQTEKYKCDLCSFSTCDESGIASHRNVHSLNYHKGTKELRKHNTESGSHPRPKIIKISGAVPIWVVEQDYETHNLEPRTNSPEPEQNLQRRPARSKNGSPSTLTAVTEITKEPKVYSCEHCDYTDSSECSFKDHVKLHFSAILFPKAEKYLAPQNESQAGGDRPFQLIATSLENPDQSFALNYDHSDDDDGSDLEEGDVNECSTDRIIIEI